MGTFRINRRLAAVTAMHQTPLGSESMMNALSNEHLPMDLPQLSDLIQPGQPEPVLVEILNLCDQMPWKVERSVITEMFRDSMALFQGKFPGYRACNTEYHDLSHTLEVTLAMARMMHGAVPNDPALSARHLMIGLAAALFHDAGYIQELEDVDGTGAKYTSTHVLRSADFLKRHAGQYEFLTEEIRAGMAMIVLTDLMVDPATVPFDNETFRQVGEMLAAADLLAQLADRTYLEKLLFLYREFKEGGIGGYRNERDLLERTIGFYDAIANRLGRLSIDYSRFIKMHFNARWGVPADLYAVSIANQRKYLDGIVQDPKADHREHLKRGGIVARVIAKYGDMY
jgi:HD superfamily phosphodiesterase